MTRPKKASQKTVSIEDVARLAGVSVSTVSRVINRIGNVKEENKRKVLSAIKKLKFQPSVYAQRLASGKSNVIMLVIPRYEGIFYSFYALELIRGIGTLCDVFKLDLQLHLTDSRTMPNFRGVGGVIFADIIGNRFQLEEALTLNIPCVVINHLVADLEVNCVSIDNEGGSKTAVEYLIGLGHRRIAHITGDLITQAAQQRLQGYQRALSEAKIEVPSEYIVKTDYSRGQARTAAEKLLKLDNPPSAIFVASDAMALEVMTVAREMEKDVPKDLSIIGFDDNPSGLYGPVALSTVRQPLVKMAEEGIKILHSLMEKKETKVKKIVLPTELVIRESCAPVS